MHRVSDFELASRLSFFLWSSIPDDELLNLAEQGKLKDPTVLAAAGGPHAGRSASRKRSSATSPGQWLYLRNLAQVKPDPDVSPNYDSSLRQSFRAGNGAVLQCDPAREPPGHGSAVGELHFPESSGWREHYGIPNVYGSQFRRVTLTDPNRGGLLGQGSMLTVTSYPNRTSVVQRGKWVLENLLGSPPPPPPPDVPSLEAHGKDGKHLTMRQQMEQHRANPVCASCHSRMDPIGFALENYDGVGAWRDKDAGSVIDASGKLPDGTSSTVRRV